jgi:hypothetical protein
MDGVGRVGVGEGERVGVGVSAAVDAPTIGEGVGCVVTLVEGAAMAVVVITGDIR